MCRMYTISRREKQTTVLQETEDFTVWVSEKEKCK